MEELLLEPGPRNPLLFLAFSIVGKIPSYTPNESEILNQVECMIDLLNSTSESLLASAALISPIVVACDAAMTVSSAESKKSVEIRVRALDCLLIIVKKLSLNINSLVKILPGILSRMIKMTIGRIDTEVDRILDVCLEIIFCLISAFWNNQKLWNDEADDLVLKKETFRKNIDTALSSLQPFIQSKGSLAKSQRMHLLSSTFQIHLNSHNDVSDAFIKTILMLVSDGKLVVSSCPKFTAIYSSLINWFDESEDISSIHESVFTEHLQILLGIFQVEAASSIVLVEDIFRIIGIFRAVHVSVSDSVSIEYCDDVNVGISKAFLSKGFSELSAAIVPVINFKSAQSCKFSESFFVLLQKLETKAVQMDSFKWKTLVSEMAEESIEEIITKIDCSSRFLDKVHCSDIIEGCLNWYSLISSFSIENGQILHLACLKALWTFVNRHRPSFGPMLRRCSLLMILSAMASDWLILREVSTQILKGIATIYDISVVDFLKEHQIFILDRLGAQLALPEVFPEVPRILMAFLKHLTEAETILLCSDMLIKRVEENLIKFQHNTSYCKDLLFLASETVVSLAGSEEKPIIEPKDFAFRTPNGNDAKRSDSERLCVQQKVILDLLKVALHFILSDSLFVRIAATKFTKIALGAYCSYSGNGESSNLCQIIHTAWPNLVLNLKDSSKDAFKASQLDVNNAVAGCECASALFKHLPIFMRDRFVKDYWRMFLKSLTVPLKLELNRNTILLHESYLNALHDGILFCKPSTEVCTEVVDKMVYLDCVNSSTVVLKVFSAINEVEPDIIWYLYSIQLGGVDCLEARHSELLSFNSNLAEARLHPPQEKLLKRELGMLVHK